jgi:hypothetical protein
MDGKDTPLRMMPATPALSTEKELPAAGCRRLFSGTRSDLSRRRETPRCPVQEDKHREFLNARPSVRPTQET